MNTCIIMLLQKDIWGYFKWDACEAKVRGIRAFLWLTRGLFTFTNVRIRIYRLWKTTTVVWIKRRYIDNLRHLLLRIFVVIFSTGSSPPAVNTIFHGRHCHMDAWRMAPSGGVWGGVPAPLWNIGTETVVLDKRIKILRFVSWHAQSWKLHLDCRSKDYVYITESQ